MNPVEILNAGGDMALRMWAVATVGCSPVTTMEERLAEAEKLVQYVKGALKLDVQAGAN